LPIALAGCNGVKSAAAFDWALELMLERTL
jgi:hypothetical protein